MIDVLMIALEFAPIPTTGAFRMIEFAKRLPALGIRPVVLTIDTNQAELIWGAKRDMALLADLPRAVRVEFIHSSIEPRPEKPLQRLLRLLCSFDDKFEHRLIGDLQSKVAQLAKEYNFAVVYSTAPPFGAAGLGEQIAKMLGLPYLIDMRDAWSEWSPAPAVSRHHHRRKAVDERRAFGAADRVIGVTEELVALFRRCHPNLPADRFAVVTNGFSNYETISDQVEWADNDIFLNVGYVGNFYYVPPKAPSIRFPHRFLQYDSGKEDWSYRSPLYFFKAWQALSDFDQYAAERIRFHIVGNVPDWLPEMAESHGVLNKCVFHGSKHRDQIPAFLSGMTGLLATSMKRLNDYDYCLASKTFEYISSSRPTLAFVCEGSQKRFFEKSGGAFFFDPDDARGAALTLQSLSGKSRSLKIDKSFLEFYALERTSVQMANELKRLAKKTVSDRKHAA